MLELLPLRSDVETCVGGRVEDAPCPIPSRFRSMHLDRSYHHELVPTEESKTRTTSYISNVLQSMEIVYVRLLGLTLSKVPVRHPVQTQVSKQHDPRRVRRNGQTDTHSAIHDSLRGTPGIL